MHSNCKIDTYISFPLYDLDLNDYIVKDNNDKQNKSSTKYDLVAVSNHTGSLSCGHYTTYAKNSQDGNWYLFDDDYVRKLDGDNNIVTKNAYILIYVQKNTNEKQSK
jgi:ubiquitin C-terminal hydrolase